MKTIAFFDSKKYDIEAFGAVNGGRYELRWYDTKLSIDSVELARGKDAVCCFVNDTVDRAVIDRLCDMGIGLLLVRCAGYNNVDLSAAKGRLRVMRVPAYSPHAIAEHAMALLLTLERKIHKAYIRSRDFNFDLTDLTGHTLYGKTVGVVGTGKIGYAFANICRGFGMRVLASDPYPNPSLEAEYVPLDRLIEESNVISLHCPLTDENYHMINADTIARMKDRVVIINTSRGGLIDSAALLAGLKGGKIRAAGLDVYEEEAGLFFSDNSAKVDIADTLRLLISLPNVIVTSHQGYLTYEALHNIAATTLENADAFFGGRESENEVGI